ncbi:MAG: 1-phosphofructokinase family hexose kinase [Caldilineales bacterium]|nr:1-phosphofructokinase family hexose kinase [Caldilineales bacterium]MDW8318195.1 1-phosphofructokinase family hexose kinase [Anaerolineae bacterium]
MTIITVTPNPAVDKVLRVPQLRPDEATRATVQALYGGGKGNNVARALVRLGAKVVATGFQGGHTGALAMERLAAEGIQTEFVVCREDTRTSLLIYEEASGHTYAIYEPGHAVTPEEIEALRDRVERLLPQAALCLLCGSGQSDAVAALFADIVARARARGVPCLLDSSGAALRAGIEARPFLVKTNLAELSDYVGYPLAELSAQRQALMELHARGVAIAALSRGPRGLLATDGNTLWEGVLTMSRVVNVVGCGDSLLAGMAYALSQGADLPTAVRWGVACGAANTQVVGAGFIERSEVEKLLPAVVLRPVDTGLG